VGWLVEMVVVLRGEGFKLNLYQCFEMSFVQQIETSYCRDENR
jgi:hypothetical protein